MYKYNKMSDSESSQSEKSYSSKLSSYKSDNESEEEMNEIDEAIQCFLYSEDDEHSVRYKSLTRLENDIEFLSEIIKDGCDDLEALHCKEDTLMKAFIYNISKRNYNTDDIDNVAKLFIQIPSYDKYYS